MEAGEGPDQMGFRKLSLAVEWKGDWEGKNWGQEPSNAGPRWETWAAVARLVSAAPKPSSPWGALWLHLTMHLRSSESFGLDGTWGPGWGQNSPGDAGGTLGTTGLGVLQLGDSRRPVNMQALWAVKCHANMSNTFLRIFCVKVILPNTTISLLLVWNQGQVWFSVSFICFSGPPASNSPGKKRILLQPRDTKREPLWQWKILSLSHHQLTCSCIWEIQMIFLCF